jgi:hypothetical protein
MYEGEEQAGAAGDMSDESDCESDGGHDNEDDSSDEEVVPQACSAGVKGKCHDLEWDDSTV